MARQPTLSFEPVVMDPKRYEPEVALPDQPYSVMAERCTVCRVWVFENWALYMPRVDRCSWCGHRTRTERVL